MLSRLAVSGYRLRDTYDITSYLSLEAMDSLLPYLDMDLSEFISGLPSMEWHPSGRTMSFSNDMYLSMAEASGMRIPKASRPTVASINEAADILGIDVYDLIRMNSMPDDGIRKQKASFGPLSMRGVAMLFILSRTIADYMPLDERELSKRYGRTGGWDMTIIKLNSILRWLSLSYLDFLRIMDPNATEIDIRPSEDGCDPVLERDDITYAIREAYRRSGISLSRSADILDTDTKHMRRQFHRDGYRTMLLSTVSRLAYPLGWGMEEAFREALRVKAAGSDASC